MANPFMQNDPEEEKAYRQMVVSCIAGASLVILLFLIVLLINTDKKQPVKGTNESTPKETEEEFVYGESNLVSSDLDFWDMYDDDRPKKEEDSTDTVSYKDGKNKKKKNNEETEEEEEGNKESKNNEEDKEDQLEVVDEEGNTTYYEILKNVDKNTYDFENKLTKNDDGIAEYSGTKEKSINGITLDKDSGDIDFAKVKEKNIDYCMLKIANRGYTTGVISLDEKFVQYAEAAKNNGINIGVYFESSAINDAEAVEEASFAVGAVGNYGVKYPIAIVIDAYKGEQGNRSDKLSMKERTAICKAFCDTVKQYNYKPVIKGSRASLISELNLEDLNDYEVWISDYSYPTDYPYEFTMWEYSNDIKIDGIDKTVPVSISFVDYLDK